MRSILFKALSIYITNSNRFIVKLILTDRNFQNYGVLMEKNSLFEFYKAPFISLLKKSSKETKQRNDDDKSRLGCVEHPRQSTSKEFTYQLRRSIEGDLGLSRGEQHSIAHSQVRVESARFA